MAIVEESAALIGRNDELNRLAGALAAARAGEPQVVLVEGAAGVGKSALMRSFAGDQADVAVVWAAGDASERAMPLALADQLVRRARGGAPLVASQPAQYAAAGLEILGALSEHGGTVILVVDDAHWADPSSLRALLFALRRLVSDTVLTLLSVRTGGRHALPEAFARLAAPRLELGPLDLGEVRALARNRGLPLSAQALRHVYELSAGVPLHVCALLDEWSATGDFEHIAAPPSYAALIAGRLSRCGEQARRLVEAASVLGRDAPVGDVASVAGVDTPLAALEQAAEQDLIRVTKRSIEFTHPLVRTAVHDALGPARLAELHTAAAALAQDPTAALLHRAHAAVLPDERLAGELDAAARAYAEGGNWLRAADLLSEAAELSTTRDAQERRFLDSVTALADAGDLVAARARVPKISEFGTSAERELVLGRIALSDLDVEAAARHFEAGWVGFPTAAPQIRMRIASELAWCAYFRLDARSQLDWAGRATELAPSTAAARDLALSLAMSGRVDEALALLDRELSGAAPRDRIAPLNVRGRLRLVADDLAGAREDLAKVRAAAIRGASSRSAAMALGRLSFVEYYAGRWELALAYAEQGLAVCVDRTDYAQITAVRAPAVLVLAGTGAWTEAQHHVQAMLLESGGVALPQVYTAFAGAHLAAAKCDPDAVLAALGPILALASREPVAEPGIWPWQDLCAEALVELGRLDEAERFLALHEARAHSRGRRSMIGRLARSRALLEATLGNDELAHEAFARSAAALRAVGMPYELGLTELAHGRFLRRRRRRRAAVELLADARERFASAGAEPARMRCERELQASGLQPKRPSAKGRLTPQELTVARLVIAGMTNREIASELMVSTKTVEVHLTRVYAKLELASRAELRAGARSGELELLG